MAALWLLGVSLVLLTVDVHCMPVKQGPSPATTTGWGENPAPGSNSNAYYYVFAPGAGGDRTLAVSQPPPQGYGYSVPSGAQAAPSLSSVSAFSGNVPAVAPPGPASVGGEAALGPIMPGPYFPPQPDYQAGQLSHVERSHEFGDDQTETEEGSQSPPFPNVLPMAQEASQLTSSPRPRHWLGGGWGPYPYYDYMFLTGQYPPGTLTYSSNSFEHGQNYWQNVRYRRPTIPYVYPQPEPVPVVPVTPQDPVTPQEQTLPLARYW